MKSFPVLTGLGIAAIVLVTGLYATYDGPNSKPNGFKRRFINDKPDIQQVLELSDDGYYFAGIDDSAVYLGHYRRKLHLVKVNLQLTDTQQVRLQIEDSDRYRFSNLELAVVPPYFYLADGVIPASFRGDLNGYLAKRFMPNKSYFIRQKPISSSLFINRLLLDTVAGQVLATETASGRLDIRKDLLQKQLDGQFCVEGKLHYDAKTQKLTYVYTYRNEFFLTDTNLNLLSRHRTIDTNTRVKFSVATIKSNGEHTMSSPPHSVNTSSCVDAGMLFIHSALKADNEPAKAFRKNTVIDVYDQENGDYLHSFYLPEKEVREFRVKGRKLLLLAEDRLQVYTLNEELFIQNILHVKQASKTEHL